MRKICPENPNPDKPEPNRKKLITKARKNENTKNRRLKFRAFQLSCFRDEKKITIKCKEIAIKNLKKLQLCNDRYTEAIA